MNWFIHSLKNYANFSGRANRREWWIFWFFLCLPAVLLVVLDQYAPETVENGQNEFFGLVLFVSAAFVALWGLGLLVPYLSVTVRRLHDIGLSAWWLLLVFVPIIGAIFFLAVTLTRGNRAPNRFGTPPQPVGNEQAVALGNVSGEVDTSLNEKRSSKASDETSRHDLLPPHGEAKSSEKLVRLIAGLAIALFAAVCALLFRYQTVTVQTAEGERTGTMDRLSGKISIAPFTAESPERYKGSVVRDTTPRPKIRDWVYTVNTDDKLTVVSHEGDEDDVRIPEKIDGRVVASIGRDFLSKTEGYRFLFGKHAFGKHDGSRIERVSIPDTVIQIERWAFKAARLESINIPDGLLYVEFDAFRNAELACDVIIPNSVKSIGDNAFKDCKISGRIILPAKFNNDSERKRIGLPSRQVAEFFD
jgi:uncharacterized membrane protein YhaH (DUF805 family)